jgi:Heterokaryon incompatibility protein (HET)
MAVPYRPLDRTRQEVRFLSQSCANVRSGTLSYELVHWRFDESTRLTKVPFLALSYVWGPREAPDAGSTISVDGKRVPVSRNLRAALSSLCDPRPRAAAAGEESSNDGWERMRHFDSVAEALRILELEGEESLAIWVDALCINQADLDEKSHQIRFMPRIYTNAFSVIMWLGEEEESDELAFDLIRDAPHGPIVELFKSADKSKHWEALGRLFARPYWSRVWILQEVLLSRNAAMLCCGSLKIVWFRAAMFFEKLEAAALVIASEASRNFLCKMSRNPVSLAVTYWQRVRGSKFSFLDYLVMVASRDCTDARDRVFGILGVCDSEDIEVNYSKPVKDIFRDTTRYLILQDQSLDVLSACKLFNYMAFVPLKMQNGGFEWLRDGSAAGQIISDRTNAFLARNAKTLQAVIDQTSPLGFIPSWVPRWSPPVSESHHLLLKDREKCHFKASGDTNVSLYAADDDDLLILDGFQVDAIEATCERLPLSQFWSIWDREAKHRNPYGDEHAQRMAYKGTMVCGRGPYGRKDDITNLRGVDVRLGFDNATMLDLVKADPTGLRGIAEFEQAALDNFLGSQLLITEGNYMGRGPPEMQKGDWICIFLGGKVPYVIRRLHTRWMLIGECCKCPWCIESTMAAVLGANPVPFHSDVHGIMEGEAWTRYAASHTYEGKLAFERFSLI